MAQALVLLLAALVAVEQRTLLVELALLVKAMTAVRPTLSVLPGPGAVPGPQAQVPAPETTLLMEVLAYSHPLLVQRHIMQAVAVVAAKVPAPSVTADWGAAVPAAAHREALPQERTALVVEAAALLMEPPPVQAATAQSSSVWQRRVRAPPTTDPLRSHLHPA